MPQTFMNRSGESVKSILAEYSARIEDCLVLVDDFHLALGHLRFRTTGSSGGHKGLASICEAAGEEFSRLRLGIGPKPPNDEILRFVLGKWRWSERARVRRMVNRAVEALDIYIESGIQQAMSQYNARVD